MLNGIKQVIKSLTPQTLRPRAVAERMWRRLETNSIVVSGPFAGLNYPWQSVGSVHLPKLMGVYELVALRQSCIAFGMEISPRL
jgi:hypothetical protein